MVAAFTTGAVLVSCREALERHLVHRPAAWACERAAGSGIPCLDHVRILCGVKGAFDGLGLLRDDEEKHPGGRVRLALALFPIAKSAQRETIAGRELSLR